MVVGYPVGGDSISVTKGVVSRVDMRCASLCLSSWRACVPQLSFIRADRFSVDNRAYSHGGNTLLTVQIDAAINPGNSGGPAFSDVEVRGG